MNIETISTKDLLKDRKESIEDVGVCSTALRVGVTQYSGGSVQERLDVNKKIIEKINKELERRNYD